VPPCSKISYPTQQKAVTALYAIRRKPAASNKKLPAGVHWCRTCHARHLTSQRGIRRPPWQKRRGVKT
jgi:hypothetical protein